MILYSGFLMGLLGSLHCLGMCGPIALALPSDSRTKLGILQERLTYNFGRIITYSLMGMIVGFIGQAMIFTGAQAYLSASVGLMLVIPALFSLNPDRLLLKLPFLKSWMTFIREKLRIFIRRRGTAAFFMIGLLNGFLPCGMVAAALMGAVASGNSINGALYMAFFGAGTLPAMLFVAFAGKYIDLEKRKRLQKIYPYLMFALGVYLMYRGIHAAFLVPESVHDCH